MTEKLLTGTLNHNQNKTKKLFRQSKGKLRKFRLRKARVEFAFFVCCDDVCIAKLRRVTSRQENYKRPFRLM